MWRENPNSILVTGVPRSKSVEGGARHIEHEDETARVDFQYPTGKVEFLHTPDNPFHRVHEIMHSRHSDVSQMQEQYDGLNNTVAQVTEDCRIHTRFWPWRYGNTPEAIKLATRKFMRQEIAEVKAKLVEDPTRRGTWPDFATRLRQAAIRMGMGSTAKQALKQADFMNDEQKQFAYRVLRLIASGREGDAAEMLQLAFFGEPKSETPSVVEDERSGKKRRGRNGASKQPPMAIVNLPLTEAIPEAKIGYRRATSGSRLHRPSLRKPVLPQKIFKRRTPREAAGTILVDASGSMGDFNEVTRWLKRAPFGTIAYYAGDGRKGWLWIYAKNGRRAAEPEQPPSSGNTVDGPALTWLMSQPGPRTFVTDRGFCDVDDSYAQIMRLAQLEKAGKVTVVDYAHDSPPDE